MKGETQPLFFFFKTQIKEIVKAPRHWPLVTGEFPAQRASNVENVSIWWRHHGKSQECLTKVAKFGPFPCTFTWTSHSMASLFWIMIHFPQWKGLVIQIHTFLSGNAFRLCLKWQPFCPAWISNTSILKCGMKLFKIHSQTSVVHGNSFYQHFTGDYLSMKDLKLNYVSKRGP